MSSEPSLNRNAQGFSCHLRVIYTSSLIVRIFFCTWLDGPPPVDKTELTLTKFGHFTQDIATAELGVSFVHPISVVSRPLSPGLRWPRSCRDPVSGELPPLLRVASPRSSARDRLFRRPFAGTAAQRANAYLLRKVVEHRGVGFQPAVFSRVSADKVGYKPTPRTLPQRKLMRNTVRSTPLLSPGNTET